MSLRCRDLRRVAVLALCAASLAACNRESRLFRQPATAASTPPESRIGELRASDGPYDRNAWSVGEGKRLYVWFNCAGCHGVGGGGGMGPALMDEKWLYGHESQDVFTSIAKGRPNGMPAFGERIPELQVWQL